MTRLPKQEKIIREVIRRFRGSKEVRFRDRGLSRQPDGPTWMDFSPSKMARLMLAEWALLGIARPTVAALERVVGKSQHAIFPQRHATAVLESLLFLGACEAISYGCLV